MSANRTPEQDDPTQGSGESFVGELIVDRYEIPPRTKPGVELRFSARKLIKLDWLSKSDPLVAVFAQTRDGKWEFIDKTEFKKNADNPTWDRSIYLPVNKAVGIDESTPLRFNVYDVDDDKVLNDDDIIGFVSTNMRDLIASGQRNGTSSYALKSKIDKKQRKLNNSKSTLNVTATYYQPPPKVVPVETDLHDINDPWSLGQWDGNSHQFRKRRVRVQQVPYIRRVKVPMYTRKVVPTTFQKRIKTKKLVEVQAFEDVQENYTEFEEVDATREKKVWVQRSTTEEYTKKIPVTKTRKVKKPVTRIQTVDDFQMVAIPGTKVVEVEGFRVDTVEDRKLVEVEEWQVFELLPHHTGKLVAGNVRDLGTVVQRDVKRTAGSTIYTEGDTHVLASRGIDVSAIPTDGNTVHYSSAPLYSESGKWSRSSIDMSGYRTGGFQGEYSSANTASSGGSYSSGGSSSSSGSYSSGGSFASSGGDAYTTSSYSSSSSYTGGNGARVTTTGRKASSGKGSSIFGSKRSQRTTATEEF